MANNEITVKALLLGILLSMLMAVTNVYLGLKIGLTVSASIPSSVLSLLLLKRFKKHNILENNIVQTAASAGESLAAGFIFTLPALLIIGTWQEAPYLFSVAVIALGGVLGVVFSVPLRKTFILRKKLKFPEGIATAEILRAAYNEKSSIRFAGRYLLIGGCVAGLGKFASEGLHLWRESLEGSLIVKSLVKGKSVLFSGGIMLSPALLGVGYIVGLEAALAMFLGGVISWFICLPIFSVVHSEALISGNAAMNLWNSEIRFLGVGAMLVGGIATLWSLRSLIVSSVRDAFKAVYRRTESEKDYQENCKEDLPFWVFAILLSGIIFVVLVAAYSITDSIASSLFCSFILVFATYLFSVVSAYMAGIIGSSNNPVSGVTIATVLIAGVAFSLMFSEQVGILLSVIVGAFVCCAAAIAGDNLQDLKAGDMLGASPARQQIMQLIGVISAAFVIPPVMNILHKAYTLGSSNLLAPQATLIANIVTGVFGSSIPWDMIVLGGLIAILVINFEYILSKKAFKLRLPVMAVAIGLYLPIALTTTVFIGGLLSFLNEHLLWKNILLKNDSNQLAVLLAAGFITGEAIIGIILAGVYLLGIDISNTNIYYSPYLGMITFAIYMLLFILMGVSKNNPLITSKSTTGKRN